MYEVLDNISFELDFDQAMKGLRLHKRNPQVEEIVRELITTTSQIARPKAIYKVSAVENKDGDTLEIDGVKFRSHVLSVNSDKLNRVFPYVATCGREFDAIKFPPGDVLKNFCMDAIRVTLLGQAVIYMTNRVKKRYDLGQTGHMNPGSLADWPLTQQRPLFSLFPDVEKQIGVKLAEGNVMQPLKSISGILFTTEVKYENCQLCPREKCPGRRSPYDPELVKKYAL